MRTRVTNEKADGEIAIRDALRGEVPRRRSGRLNFPTSIEDGGEARGKCKLDEQLRTSAIGCSRWVRTG